MLWFKIKWSRYLMIVHSENMVTPWCINCTYCYVHHKKKKACTGCRQKDETKSVACQKCKIKACILYFGFWFTGVSTPWYFEASRHCWYNILVKIIFYHIYCSIHYQLKTVDTGTESGLRSKTFELLALGNRLQVNIS